MPLAAPITIISLVSQSKGVRPSIPLPCSIADTLPCSW
uniref:Uncharacterized protein n=1 Tax=Rhizophora mucronata TaxID=61149 RepID=A0A2P2JGR1_RHIMU